MSNTPTPDEQSRARREQRQELVFNVALLFVFGIMAAAACAFTAGYAIIIPRFSIAAAVSIALGAVCIVILIVVCRLTRCSPLISGAMIALMLCCGFVFVPLPERMVCGTLALKRGTHVRGLVQYGLREFRRSATVPDSILALAAEDRWLEPWESRVCGCETPGDVRVGRYSIQDVIDGRVTPVVLRVESVAVRTNEIERIGRIAIWHNADAWKAGAVVAWRLRDGCGGYDEYVVVTSEPVVRCLSVGDAEEVADYLKAAEVKGIRYPDELLRLFEDALAGR